MYKVALSLCMAGEVMYCRRSRAGDGDATKTTPFNHSISFSPLPPPSIFARRYQERQTDRGERAVSKVTARYDDVIVTVGRPAEPPD